MVRQYNTNVMNTTVMNTTVMNTTVRKMIWMKSDYISFDYCRKMFCSKSKQIHSSTNEYGFLSPKMSTCFVLSAFFLTFVHLDLVTISFMEHSMIALSSVKPLSSCSVLIPLTWAVSDKEPMLTFLLIPEMRQLNQDQTDSDVNG